MCFCLENGFINASDAVTKTMILTIAKIKIKNHSSIEVCILHAYKYYISNL